ncbi:unnamed protein product [Trichobilharzia szidati]|nr:unnamed protein product [Trichobilharzia szidati]
MSWDSLRLPEYILKALKDAGLHTPTPIQLKAIPPALNNTCDILGSAPTGSGKTLAFGIPLITRIYSLKCSENQVCNEELTVENPAPITDKKPEQECSEENSCIEPPAKKKTTDKKKKKKKDKMVDIYSGLDVIEELDADTGEVRAMHSLNSVSTTCPETFESTEPPPSLSVQMKANRVYGLVLVPTRELAIQVSQHLRMLTRYIDCIRIETIMGGISIDKQLRLLQRCPDILVATPGRLWHFIQQDEPHILTLPNVSVVVIDEADRMIEANHFDDLRAIFDWLHTGSMSSDGGVNDDEEGEAVECENSKKTKNLKRKSTDDSGGANAIAPTEVDRQTLVFSATLTFVHSGALKPGSGSKKHKMLSGGKSNMTKKIKLALLRQMFGLRKSVQVIDLSSSSSPNSQLNQKASTAGQHSQQQQPACPDGLCESRLLCPNQESKDNRLFWFITFGRQLASACLPVKLTNQRCLIFLNSKSGVRRLAGVLRQLVESDAFSVGGYSSSVVKHISVLHADMIQKQRLRALERFQADPNGILLASDVAARGLDLASKDTTDETSGVSWVIHFDVPHTAELYIHRSGRTARANRQGTSLLFISPNEIIRWHKIAVSLKRNNPELEDFAVQPSNIHLTICEQIVQLAKQIDIQVHRNSRKTANENWFAKAAKDANILLDDDDDNSGGDDDGERGGYSEKKKSKKKNSDDTKPLKLQLRQLINASREKLLKNTNGPMQHVYGKLQTLSKVKLLKEVCV